MLDNQNALTLTNKAIVESKKVFLGKIKPELMNSKKRKLKQISGGEMSKNIVEYFMHEEELQQYYEEDENSKHKSIKIKVGKGKIKHDLYTFLCVKEMTQTLDLKKEVILTMLNQLEKLGPEKSFFKLEGTLPNSIGIRFHNSSPEQMAEENDLIREFLDISKVTNGVYRCTL